MTSIPQKSRRRLRARATWTARTSAATARASAAIAIAALLAAGAAACGVKRFEPPADPGVPLPDAAAAWAQASATCAPVRSFTAELGLSGRAAGTRLRGKIQAGFQAPGGIRLEGVAPFGQPVFILAGDATSATLLLPRDERVVRAAAAAEILEALAGVRLEADALRAVLAGCVVTGVPTSATVHDDLARFVFDEGEVYARRAGDGWRIVAGLARPFLVEYLEHTGMWPRRVRISRQLPGNAGVDLTLAVSQIETNVTLPPEAFTIDIPPGAMPMSVEQLRQAGPLGEQDR